MSHNNKGGTHPVSGPNPAQQHHLDSTDINRITAKHLVQRAQGNPQGRKPMFIEVSSASFHDMMNRVSRIKEDFDRLPARLRQRFLNSPGVLLAFTEDPANRREAVSLGLIEDPELLYQIEAEKASKRPIKPVQVELVPRVDPEANPGYKAPREPKTPSPS